MFKHIDHERDTSVLTLIKDDSTEQTNPSNFNTTLQTAQTIAIKWARFGLIPYLYDRYTNGK